MGFQNTSNSNVSEGSFFKEMINHKKLHNYVIYCLSNLFFGQIITCLGPLFPYLADSEGKSQTEYSLLFTARALGFLVGSVSIRYVENKFTLHQLSALGIALMGLSAVFFYFVDHLWSKSFFILISAIGCAYQNITINLSAMECFKGQNLSRWIQILQGVFGAGGLIGPLVVYLLQLKSILLIGACSLIPMLFYFHLPSPESPIPSQTHLQQNQPEHHTSIPHISLYLIAAGFFFVVGQQCVFAGWVSSYAVLNDFSTKEQATIYCSIFWISITFFRFSLAVFGGKPSYKIKILSQIGIISGVISYFLIFYINPQFGLTTMSILYGLNDSLLFAFFLTVSQEFGFKLTVKQTTTLMIWASIGQGSLTVGVGKLMQYLSYNWFIYGMMGINIALYTINKINSSILSQQKQRIHNNRLLNKDYSILDTKHGMIQLMNIKQQR